MIYLEVHPIYTYVYNVAPGSPAHAALYAQLFYMVPGYEENDQYLAGMWNGRESLIVNHVDSRGRACYQFLTGLLDRVVKILDSRGEQHEIVSMVKPWDISERRDYGAGSLPVRKYQVSAAMSLIGNTLPRKGGVINVATGGGKTRIAAKATQLWQTTTVFLVNQVDLMHQTIAEMEAMLGCKVGQVGDGKCDIRDVTVATIQTVAMAAGAQDCATASDKKINFIQLAEILCMMQEARVVFVDECHGVAARTARAAVCTATNVFAVVGLSASPWRDDGMDILIEAICGGVTFKISASELIQLGFLVHPEITMHEMPMPSDLASRSNNVMEFHKLYKDWVVDDVVRNNYIVSIAQSHLLRGHVIIILVKYVEHGEKLAAKIPDAVFLNGGIKSKKKRSEILANVKSGVTRVLIATSLADQGLDIPVASVLILAGGGKSSTKATQRIGRVLRIYPGKTCAYVHDIVDQHKNLLKHYRERLKMYKLEPAFVLHHLKVR